MKKQILFALICFISIRVFAIQYNFGPRITAMGMNSASINDNYAIGGNPAGLLAVQSVTLTLNYIKSIIDVELSQETVGLILPGKNNSLGFAFHRYGISTYNEITAGTMFARKFGEHLAIAIRLNYDQIKILNYGITRGFSVDLGSIYKMNDQFSFGIYLNNPTLRDYDNNHVKISIDHSIYLGAAYQASDKVIIATTISKVTDLPYNVALGIEYQIVKSIHLRTGITTVPFKQFAGFGLVYKKLNIDFALESDPFLTYTPQIGIVYAF